MMPPDHPTWSFGEQNGHEPFGLQDETVSLATPNRMAGNLHPERIAIGAERISASSRPVGTTDLQAPRHFGPVKLFLLFCSGVKLDALRRCSTEDANYVGLGGAVLTAATFATVSSSAALAMALHRPVLHMLPFGILWGLTIFNLDRWIVSTAMGQHLGERLANFLVRIVLAVIMSFVIAEPLLLTVFEPEIQQEIVHIKTTTTAEQHRLIDAKYAPELKEVRNRRKDLQIRLDQQRAAIEAQWREATEEAEGRSATKLPGFGPIFERKEAAYQAAKQRLDELRRQFRPRLAELSRDEAGLERRKAQEKRTADVKIGTDAGLLRRIRALSNVTADNLAVAVAAWLLRLIVIVVDTLPVLLKLLQSLGGQGSYEQLIAAYKTEDQHRANLIKDQADRDERIEKIAREAIDKVRMALIHTYRDYLLVRDTAIRRKLGLDEVVPVASQSSSTSPPPVHESEQLLLDGRWECQDRLPRSTGLGEVRFARDRSGRYSKLAVAKLVHDPTPTSERTHQVELSVYQRIHSDHVATLLDSGYDEKNRIFYLVTPYYDEGDLQDYLRRNGVNDIETFFDLTEGILEGLLDAVMYADVEGHLDLKPSNVVVQDGQARIIDFGISRVRTQSEDESRRFHWGTPWFCAPEQNGPTHHGLDTRCDLYAIAAILYWMATGQAPYELEAGRGGFKNNYPQALRELIQDPEVFPARLDTRNANVPAPVADLVQRWLSLDPDARQPNVDGTEAVVRNALENFRLARQSIPAAPREV